MVVCTVVDCTSRSLQGGKHFFRFPKENSKNIHIRKLWIQFTRRGKSFDPKTSVICEDHFAPDCFIQKKKGRLYLHKNSVPTIYYRETKQKLEKIEIPYNADAQEYIGSQHVDLLYSASNAEIEQELLQERQSKVQQLKNLCRFCFENEKDIKCVTTNKLEVYQIYPDEILTMLGIDLQYNDFFSDIICEKCFQQVVDMDVYRKKCRKAQNEVIMELHELDQKIEQIQNIKREENPWFKVEIIETTLGDVDGTVDSHFELIEEHLEERENVYEEDDEYQEAYVHEYHNDNLNEEEEEEEEEEDENIENDELEEENPENNLEESSFEVLRRGKAERNLFNEKDKYNIIDKDVVIKNPDRNCYAYRIYECFFCRLKFAGRKTYKAHDCEVKEVKCEVEGCDKVFTKQSGYNQHIVKIHGHLKKSKHFCPICKQVLNASDSQFKAHCKQCSKESMNKEQKMIQCEVCKKECKNLKSYTVHKMFHDARNLVKINDDSGSKKAPIFSGKGPVICELCGKEFTNNQGLRTHKKNVHLVGSKGEIFQCDICSKQRPTKRSLFNHMRNVHRIQKTPCNVCGKVFRTKALLQKHMMYHDETKRIHFCPLCPEKPGYFTAVALRRHQKSHHQGLKEYICELDYCDATFSSNHLLKQHKLQQHGINVN